MDLSIRIAFSFLNAMQIFRFPLVRLSLFFILGISAQQLLHLSSLPLLAFGVACVIMGMYKPLWLSSFSLCLLFTILGALCLSEHDSNFKSKDLTSKIIPEHPYSMRITIREKLKVSDRYRKYIGTLDQLDTIISPVKVLLYLPKTKLREDVAVGQVLYMVAPVSPLTPPLNPYGFDYAQYLRNKGIQAQIFPKAVLPGGFKKDLWYYSDALRRQIMMNCAKGFGPAELEVFHALMLGQQQEIDAAVIKSYQATGVVHILSVSGLHVGFVMVILNMMLSFLPNSRGWKTSKMIIILLGLWGFALLAGMSPSVMRSAATFSFVAFGLHLKKGSNVYNTLGASILVLLAINPKLLFDVGFQLSYVALFFIVFLKPSLDRFASPQNPILLYLRNIITVSLAAQIGTLPLSLYYFHQFPGLFLVANLFAIPLLGVIMILGIITVFWASIAPVPVALGWLTSESISFLNFLIAWVAKFDNLVFTDIWFPLTLVIASYMLIFSVGSLRTGNFSSVLFCMASIFAIQLLFLSQSSKMRRTKEFLVFHATGKSILLERSGSEATLFYNEIDEKSKAYSINPYFTFHNIEATRHRLKPLHYFNSTKILVLDSTRLFPKSEKPDVLLMTCSPRLNFERTLLDVRPKLVVADGSNYKSDVKRWKRTCEQQKIPFHATAEKGFYSIKEGP